MNYETRQMKPQPYKKIKSSYHAWFGQGQFDLSLEYNDLLSCSILIFKSKNNSSSRGEPHLLNRECHTVHLFSYFFIL